MSTTHKLGVGYGAITDHDDGTASYRKTGTLGQAFRVSIADVTGFVVTKNGKVLERELKIVGNGTELASISVGHGIAERIEAWFRAHPMFRGNSALPPSRDDHSAISGELVKLAQLRDAGILNPAEFQRAKAKLLS